MAATIIVQSQLQSSTGLPKDRFENVWHFVDGSSSPVADVAYTACVKIADFYKTDPGSGFGTVGSYLSADMGDIMTLIAYDMAAAEPRPELGRVVFAFTPGGSMGLPEEVAVCLSYYTTRNLPSYRGRLYIGPFNQTVLNTTNPARPNPNLLSSMAAGGVRLVAAGLVGALPTLVSNTLGSTTIAAFTNWALHSIKRAMVQPIAHGWIDNEWDGQSRRRVEASSRTTF
jgi:hypothetical protein